MHCPTLAVRGADVRRAASTHRIVGGIGFRVRPAGDVRITKAKGLTRADRLSIDVRKLTITEVGKKIRFSVMIRKIKRVNKFDQMIFIEMISRSGKRVGDVGFTTKGKYGYGYSYKGRDVYCDPINGVKRNFATRTFSMDVPRRCVPAGVVKVRGQSLTGSFRGDNDPWSSDKFAITGLQRLRS